MQISFVARHCSVCLLIHFDSVPRRNPRRGSDATASRGDAARTVGRARGVVLRVCVCLSLSCVKSSGCVEARAPFLVCEVCSRALSVEPEIEEFTPHCRTRTWC